MAKLMTNKFRWIAYSLILVFFFLLLSGCSKSQPLTRKVDRSKQRVVPEAISKKVVKFGFVPVRNVEEMTREFTVLSNYLSKKTGCQFEVYPFRNYEALLEKFITKEIDLATAGSFIAYRAIKELGAKPIARPEKDGISFYTGLIVVRKDSGIKRIEDLKGKSFAFVDVNTSAGYVYPRALIKSLGYNPNEFFREVKFAGRHDAAFLAVYHRQVDAAAAKNLVFKQIARDNPDFQKKMFILAESKSFPEKPIVVRADFDPVLREKIKQILLNMDKDPEAKEVLKAVKADRFIETSLSSFAEVEKFYRELYQK